MAETVTLASLPLSSLPCGTWADVVFFAMAVVFAVYDAIRGISASIATVASLIVSIRALFRPSCSLLASLMPGTPAMMQYVAASLVVVAGFLVMRFLLARFLKIIIAPPLDNILGVLSGLAKSVVVLVAAFSLLSFAMGAENANGLFGKSVSCGKIYPRAKAMLLQSGLSR